MTCENGEVKGANVADMNKVIVSARVEYNESKDAFLAIFYIDGKVFNHPKTGHPCAYYFDDPEGAMEMAESIKRNQLLINEDAQIIRDIGEVEGEVCLKTR
jgi:hypothetical protein